MDRRPAAPQKRRSGEIARRRLKFLLTADETGFPPETLEMLRDDICRTVSKYMEVDSAQIEMRVRNGLMPALYTVIPIKSPLVRGTM